MARKHIKPWQLTDRKAEDKLLTAHTQEAEKHEASFYNLGWAMTDSGIASKTNRGILETQYGDKPNTFVHIWPKTKDLT
jgi:hypothetical protein